MTGAAEPEGTTILPVEGGTKDDSIGDYGPMIDTKGDEERQERCLGAHMGLYLRWGLSRAEPGPFLADAESRDAARDVAEGRLSGTDFLIRFMDRKLFGNVFSEPVPGFTDADHGGAVSQFMHDVRPMRRPETAGRAEEDHDFAGFAAMLDARLQDDRREGPDAVRRRGPISRLLGARGPREIAWDRA